jgi:hypothetical protein
MTAYIPLMSLLRSKQCIFSRKGSSRHSEWEWHGGIVVKYNEYSTMSICQDVRVAELITTKDEIR